MADDAATRSLAEPDAALAHAPLLSGAALVGSATVVAKLAALAKDWLVARQLGAGDELDAYLVAFLLPSYAVVVLAHSFASAFVPTYVRVWQHDGLASAKLLSGRVLAVGTALLVAATLALVAAAPYVLPLVGTSFDDAKLALALRLFYPLAGVIVASGLSAMLAAVLVAHERFAAVALAPIAIPLATLAVFAALGDRYGAEALAAGTLAGFVAELLIVALAAWRAGLAASPSFGALGPHVRHIARQYWPMALGGLLMSSSLVVDQAMAASLGSGAVSVLNYGGKVVAVVLSAGAASLSTVLFPRFARLIAGRRFDELRRTIRLYAGGIALASLPVMAVLALLSEPIVRLLFERGAFTPQTTRAVAGVQWWLVPQIPFYVAAMLGARLLSALDANHLVLWIGGINLVVNVAGNYLLMRLFGVDGIAMATSVMYVVAATVTLLAVRRRLAARAAAVA